jgi:N-acetylglucosamine-6-sulfatase
MQLRRRDLLKAAGALPFSSRSAQQAPPSRPNVVFIITDDQRWDSLGVTGHPDAKTPNIDRLGREGIIFENFFCATPLCSPSRASFLTGIYPHTHRIINNDKNGLDAISHTLVTFPRILREAGYETAYIGKWHMGLDDSRRPGFDYWLSFKGQGLYIDPVLNINGESVQMTGYTTDILNRHAVEFLQKPRKQPFVMYLAHKAVHGPYLPAPRHENQYTDLGFDTPKPAERDLQGKPVLTRPVKGYDVLRLEGATPEPVEPRRGRPRDPQSIVRDQFRCLSSVDDGVGMILDTLRATGQLDDTIVIYTSDNGYLLGEHAQFNQKRFAWEESIRIPFLLRYPKMAAPGLRRQMVVSVDLAPTLLEMAGVSWPEKLHGQSFVPVLRDPSHPGRQSFLAEYFEEKVFPRCPDWQAVRTSRHKYIRYPGNEELNELYDLAADPHEQENLVRSATAGTVLERMRKELDRLLTESEYP